MTTLNAITSPAPALVTTVDSTGNLAIQTAGTNAVTYDANQNATHTGSISSVNTFGYKNRIINGHMMIDQRNAGANTTPGQNAYTVDRWRYPASQSSKFTAQQMNSANTSAANYESNSTPAGYINSLKLTSSSAYSLGSSDYFGVNQFIEGYNIADLNWGTSSAKTVTLSFWVKSSLTGTFGGGIRTGDSSNYSYPFTYAISSTNTWTYCTVVIPGPTAGTWNTSNGQGLDVWFSLGTGSTFTGTANTWAASNYVNATGSVNVSGTAGATWYITGVQLEVGSKATPFDFRDYNREFYMCQRYYETGGGTGYAYSFNIGSVYRWQQRFQVPKRATPSVTVVTPNAGSNFTTLSTVFSPNTDAFDSGANGPASFNSFTASAEL